MIRRWVQRIAAVFSSRGEQADRGDDWMAIADVIADDRHNDHWVLWEAELSEGADQ